MPRAAHQDCVSAMPITKYKAARMTWTQLKKAAQNRVRWRGVVAALYTTLSLQEYRNKSSQVTVFIISGRAISAMGRS
jgi:hypothetical protein